MKIKMATGEVRSTPMRAFGILQKYLNGRTIEQDDIAILEEMASVGLIRMGLDTYKVKLMAKTTDLGRKLIKS